VSDHEAVPDGAIDVHVHAGPSYFDRKHDALALAERIADSPLGGAVLKSHFGTTRVPAGIAGDRVPDVDLYPSVTLNSFVGGFNPVAVEHAIEVGARVVWLPTFSAANFDPSGIGRGFPFSNQALTATDGDGEVRPDVVDVLETVADRDPTVAVGNGHLSRAESLAVLDAIESRGLDLAYLVTHADFGFMGLSVEDQVELARRGAVIEKCYLPVCHGDVTIEGLAESVRTVGVESCVLSTDHGQADNASPPAAYAEFVARLRERGFGDADLRTMAVDNPRSLLGE
jgi:hypothetical protein